MSKWTSSKNHHLRRFHAKRTSPLNSAYSFAYCSTGQRLFSTLFEDYIFLRWKSLETILSWCFERWDYAETLFRSEKLRIAYIKPEIGTGKHHFWCFEDDRKVAHTVCMLSMYHGYASWLCIMVIYHGYVWWPIYYKNDSSESKKVNFWKVV